MVLAHPSGHGDLKICTLPFIHRCYIPNMVEIGSFSDSKEKAKNAQKFTTDKRRQTKTNSNRLPE